LRRLKRRINALEGRLSELLGVCRRLQAEIDA
jgi:hypothetical protein